MISAQRGDALVHELEVLKCRERVESTSVGALPRGSAGPLPMRQTVHPGRRAPVAACRSPLTCLFSASCCDACVPVMQATQVRNPRDLPLTWDSPCPRTWPRYIKELTAALRERDRASPGLTQRANRSETAD